MGPRKERKDNKRIAEYKIRDMKKRTRPLLQCFLKAGVEKRAKLVRNHKKVIGD